MRPGLDVQLIDGQATTALDRRRMWSWWRPARPAWRPPCASGPWWSYTVLGAITAWMLTGLNLVKSKFFAQPNLLADRRVVGEYFQDQIVPESIGAELLMWLDDTERRSALEREFSRIHAESAPRRGHPRGAGHPRAAELPPSPRQHRSREAGCRHRRGGPRASGGAGGRGGGHFAPAQAHRRRRRFQILEPRRALALEHRAFGAKRCVSASAGRTRSKSTR